MIVEKTCPIHGTFTDTLAIDANFLTRIEQLFPGRDFKAVTETLHNHGTSSIQYGRGSVLTIDLTNRCNMMCDPCFMDANQVGYVHELTFDDVKKLLDDAIEVKPRRQMTVQFSGGEPTISPHFLEAVAYARKVGYFSVQAATNGIRFAQEPEFAKAAAAAGMRIAYLQFDGIGEDANAHRKVGNLFDVKLRAIEHLYQAGIDVCLVVTIVNTVNNDQVGPIIRFAMENCDKISFVSFQPVSFTGRDEDISDADRQRQRYTLSHLAQDVKGQTGATEPLRDWFPLSAIGPLVDVTDLLKGVEADWGTMKCGCHPNCGIGTAFMVNKKTKKWKPVTEFLDVERFIADARTISDTARSSKLTKVQMALSLLRNYHPSKAPDGFALKHLLKKFDKQSGGALGGRLNEDDQGRSQGRRVAHDVRRRDVVPGSLHLRFPPHRDVHHPVRHADGRDLLLRLQHRRRLAPDRRAHAQERDRRGVVQDARQARRLRQSEEGGPAAERGAGRAEDPEGRPARRLRAAPEGGGARFDRARHLLTGGSYLGPVTAAPWVACSASTSTGASCSRSRA